MSLLQKLKASRRRKWLINRNFQIKFLIYTEGVAILIFAVNFLANHFYFTRLEDKLNSIGLPPSHLFFLFLDQQRINMTYILLGAGLLILGLMTIYGLLLSHRIAGPFYRLHQDLSSMTEHQKIKKISFRKKDFFLEIPEQFNQLVDVIDPTSTHDKKAVDSEEDKSAV